MVENHSLPSPELKAEAAQENVDGLSRSMMARKKMCLSSILCSKQPSESKPQGKNQKEHANKVQLEADDASILLQLASSGASINTTTKNSNSACAHTNTSKPKRKRHRRKACEIDRKYACPHHNCDKRYGSEDSLNLHIRLKHKQWAAKTAQQSKGVDRIRSGEETDTLITITALRPSFKSSNNTSSLHQTGRYDIQKVKCSKICVQLFLCST
jgi:hypothetical protein